MRIVEHEAPSTLSFSSFANSLIFKVYRTNFLSVYINQTLFHTRIHGILNTTSKRILRMTLTREKANSRSAIAGSRETEGNQRQQSFFFGYIRRTINETMYENTYFQDNFVSSFQRFFDKSSIYSAFTSIRGLMKSFS